MEPFLKWVGGKRQLLPYIKPLLPERIDYYCEPFVGAGALLFDLMPEKGLINDVNKDLMITYKNIQGNLDKLLDVLNAFENSKEFYYKIRSWDRDALRYELLSDVGKAARFLYLNKTCYKGLYRVNKNGQFNTPYGFYERVDFVNEKVLREVSEYFNRSSILFASMDYADVLAFVPKHGFVYMDPPYDVPQKGKNSSWYTTKAFDKKEQERLRRNCDYLTGMGIKFMLSNYATDFIKELYSDYDITIIQSQPKIRSDLTGDAKVDEVIIRNYS